MSVMWQRGVCWQGWVVAQCRFSSSLAFFNPKRATFRITGAINRQVYTAVSQPLAPLAYE